MLHCEDFCSDEASPAQTSSEALSSLNVSSGAALVEKTESHRSGLIAALQDIQEERGYLPEEALRDFSEKKSIPLIDIYSVATFYSSFRFKPRGKHVLQICLGTACHVRGSTQVKDELCKKLGIEPGETTPDLEHTLETVNCLGCCAIGPVLVKDGKYHGQVRIKDIDSLLGNRKECCEVAK